MELGWSPESIQLKIQRKKHSAGFEVGRIDCKDVTKIICIITGLSYITDKIPERVTQGAYSSTKMFPRCGECFFMFVSYDN